MGADIVLWWAPGIRQHSDKVILVGSWLLLATIVILGFAASWRRGLKASVRLGVVFTIASAIVCLGFIVIYGADRYQTWKMESFLLPFVVAVSIPALVALRFGTRRLGAGLVLLALGAVAMSPALTWQPANEAAQLARGSEFGPAAQTAAGVLTPAGLVNLAKSPALSNVSVLNIRLGPYFETMSAGAIISKSVVVLSSRSYYWPKTSLSTCTLTRKDLLAPGDTAYTDLGGGYVLLQRPNKCAMNS